MEQLQGHIFTGLQQCEDQDIIYKAYVMRDFGDEIEILDHENLNDWLQHGGHIQTFCVDKTEVIAKGDLYCLDIFAALKQLEKQLL